MLTKLYYEPSTYKAVQIDPEYFALDNVDTVVDGVVSRSCVVKSMSVSKQFSGFNCHDFDISTIIATGSDKLLRPVQFRNADVGSLSNAMTNLIKMFDDNEKAV